MRGPTRAIMTLLGAALAGLLLWLATQTLDEVGLSDYWAIVGLLAAAGLTLALSQLFGGWTKWGRPYLSVPVFLVGFLPVLVAVGWVILANQPEDGWLSDETRDWARDLNLDNLLEDLSSILPVLCFGLGLMLGFSFDTARREQRVEHVERIDREPQTVITPASSPVDDEGMGMGARTVAAERDREQPRLEETHADEDDAEQTRIQQRERELPPS